MTNYSKKRSVKRTYKKRSVQKKRSVKRTSKKRSVKRTSKKRSSKAPKGYRCHSVHTKKFKPGEYVKLKSRLKKSKGILLKVIRIHRSPKYTTVRYKSCSKIRSRPTQKSRQQPIPTS